MLNALINLICIIIICCIGGSSAEIVVEIKVQFINFDNKTLVRNIFGCLQLNSTFSEHRCNENPVSTNKNRRNDWSDVKFCSKLAKIQNLIKNCPIFLDFFLKKIWWVKWIKHTGFVNIVMFSKILNLSNISLYSGRLKIDVIVITEFSIVLWLL